MARTKVFAGPLDCEWRAESLRSITWDGRKSAAAAALLSARDRRRRRVEPRRGEPLSGLGLRRRRRRASLPQLTPSLRCKLVEEVVYWNSSFLSG
jgi:hypothetical protein